MFTMRKTSVCAAYVFSALIIVETLSITGQTGKNVAFECSDWNAWTNVKSNVKYLCESPCTWHKHIIIKAEFGKTKHKDRIYLNNTGNVLSVTFTDLQKSDYKTYYCGVERFGKDVYLEVNLKVTDAAKTASVGSTVSSAVTDSSMSSNSSDSVTDMSHTTFHTTSAASGTPGVGSILYLSIGLTIIITILVVLLKLVRNMKRKKLLKAPRTDPPQEDTQQEAEYHDIRSEDSQTQSSPVDVSTVHVFTDVPPDNLYANYLVTDPLTDLVYSVAQRPQEQI